MKRTIYILTILSRILSVILSGWMVGALGYSLDQYLVTRNKILASGGTPWPTPTVLWPTYLLLAMSAVSLLLNFILVIVPFCLGKEAKKRSEKMISYTSYAMIAVFVVAWAVSTGLFQMANTNNSLWGWTCGSGSDAIQDQVQSYLNFGTLCTIQGGAFYSMIIHTAVWAVTLAVYLVLGIRYMHKKKLKQLENKISSQAF